MDPLGARLRSVWIRVFGMLRGRRAEDEFQDELASHIAMHTEDGVRAGLNPEEARRRALIRLGGMEQTQQAYRERRTLPWIEELLQDVRFGVRMMGRNRGFSVVAIVTLAIGIGTTATAFTWIDAVLLQPLGGVAEPNRLVTLETVTSNGDWVPNSYPDFIDFRDQLKLFDGIAVAHVS
jgi:hypothetical protein